MVKNLRIYILFFRVPKKGMSGLPYLLKPWSTFLIKYVKLMPIPCQIGRYIQISWLPFVHLETSCAARPLEFSSAILSDVKNHIKKIRICN